MSATLYAKYLLLDQIIERVEALGRNADSLSFSSDRWDARAHFDDPQYKTYSFFHHISVEVQDMYDPEEAEAFTEAWMTAYPDTELVRLDGNIFLRGETTNGMRWLVKVGAGVCERVQVGTRIIPATEEHEEPIFEVRCPDPLRELVKS